MHAGIPPPPGGNRTKCSRRAIQWPGRDRDVLLVSDAVADRYPGRGDAGEEGPEVLAVPRAVGVEVAISESLEDQIATGRQSAAIGDARCLHAPDHLLCDRIPCLQDTSTRIGGNAAPSTGRKAGVVGRASTG